MNIKYSSALLLSSALLVACGSDNNSSGGGSDNNSSNGDTTLPTTYTFNNADGASSVSYTGQTARQVMISDMKALIGSVSLDNSASVDAAKETLYNAYGIAKSSDGSFATDVYNLDNELHGQTTAGENDEFTTTPLDTYADISGAKNLVKKTAGNDKCVGVNGDLTGQTDFIDSTTTTNFLDSETDSKCTLAVNAIGQAQQLLSGYFDEVAALTQTADTLNALPLAYYVDNEGRDYKQLTQKFLSMAVAFNQGTNDYLQANWSAKNYLVEGKPYSDAEHQWDEGFGYFGAARDYLSYTDEQIADGVVIDTNLDSLADLTREVNMGHAVNCAKRDKKDFGTNYTKDAFEAFIAGRALLAEAAKTAGPDKENPVALSADQLDQLEGFATTAANTWELCIAATAVHYINDTIEVIDALEEASATVFDVATFEEYAKVWSELRGFAIGLQYNPRSPIYDGNEANFAMALDKVREKPETTVADLADYKAELEEARELFDTIYGFTAEQGLTDEQLASW